MRDEIGVGVVRREPGAQDGSCLLVGISTARDPLEIGGYADIPGRRTPQEVECVRPGPHVGATPGNAIGVGARIVLNRAFVLDHANIAGLFELAQSPLRRQHHGEGSNQPCH